jgi:hypothetical protein
MQVRPENASRDPGAGVKHVVMIVPVDAEVNEAEHVAHEHRGKWCERSETVPMRDLHFEHHDRDDDREDAVAERLESVLAHSLPRVCLKEPPAHQHCRCDWHHKQQEQDR